MTNPNDNNQYLPAEEDNLDIKRIIFQVLSHWYWFAISLFAALFVAYLVNRYTEQVFTVNSKLIVRDDDSRGLSGQENLLKGLNLIRNTKSIQNEIGILGTYSLAQRSIKELGDDFRISYVAVGRRGIKESKLYKDCPFKVEINDSVGIPEGLPIYITIHSENEYFLEIDGGRGIAQMKKINERVNFSDINFTLKMRYPGSISKKLIDRKYYFYLNNINNLVNQYKGKVQIVQVNPKGSILVLTSSGFVAQQEADYLNKLMEVYIKNNLEEKNRIADNAIRFIDSQLISMADSLQKSEHALQNFRVENKILDLSTEGSILFDKLKLLQDQKTENDLKVWYINYLIEYIEKKKDVGDIVAPSTIGIEEPQLTLLINQLSEYYIEYREQLITSKPGGQVLLSIETKLESLKKTIREKLNSMLEANRIAEKDIDQRIAVIEKDLIQLPVNEQQLIKIERKFNILDKLYSYLLEKRAEAGISKASNIADNRVLDYALADNASLIKPNRRTNILFAIAIGLIIPALFIFITNFLNNSINDLKNVAKYTSTPILGSIGHNKFASEFPVLEKPKSTLTESFRAVRTNLQYLLTKPEQKVITITSTISGEGKTFIAANLAAIISLNNKKVLVLGLDLRKPKLQNYFGSEYQKGLSTFLIGKDSAEDVVFSTKYNNLYYVPSGPIPPNPAELIGGLKMDEFITWAKETFDYIILDTPPIAIVTDGLLTQRFTDLVLFVVRFNYSHWEVLRLVEGLRTSGSSKNVALLVNDLQHKRIYGYGYGYSYGYNYGYTYGSNYSYNQDDDKGGYYTDDEPPLTLKNRVLKFFT